MICLFGLDGAGKTTILYQWALKRAVAVAGTCGFEFETVKFKDTLFTVYGLDISTDIVVQLMLECSDVGGDDKIRNLWCVYLPTAGSELTLLVPGGIISRVLMAWCSWSIQAIQNVWQRPGTSFGCEFRTC